MTADVHVVQRTVELMLAERKRKGTLAADQVDATGRTPVASVEERGASAAEARRARRAAEEDREEARAKRDCGEVAEPM